MHRLRQALPLLLALPYLSAFAAQPEKSMFGVELEKKFAIPACNTGENAITKRNCHLPSATAKTPWGATEYHVFFPRSGTVPYPRGEMRVEVVDGIILAIHIDTWGIEAQGPAMDALKAKFGPPGKQRSEKIRALRSRTPSIFAEWEMSDFSVRYDGTTSTIDWGRISLMTPRYRQLIRAHETRR